MQNYPDNSLNRQIRSFVKRQGRITPLQKRALAQNWQDFGLHAGETKKPLELANIFGRSADIVMEIGFGMGHSLFKMAQENPDKDYIGVEVYTPGIGNLLANVSKYNLANVRVFSQDVWQVLTCSIPDNALSQVNLYFPDPWPKKRHHKRRLVQTDFVNLLAQKLKHQGLFHMATDWQNYAQHMQLVMENNSLFENIYGHNNFAPNNLRYCTKFEIRGKKLGHDIWDLVYKKI